VIAVTNQAGRHVAAEVHQDRAPPDERLPSRLNRLPQFVQ
jgi:hypothetical protein